MSGVRTALITGTCGGIGTALARVFREAGYRVVGTDVRPGPGDGEPFLQLDLAALPVDGGIAGRVHDPA